MSKNVQQTSQSSWAASAASIASATSVAATGRVSVDSHFHIFKTAQSVPGARYTPTYDASFADWQTRAAAVAVTHGVLVQTSFMGTDNRLLLAQLALQPHTLRGVAVVSPNTTIDALRDLHTQGVRGIRLNVAGQSHDIGVWAAASGLWDALLALGWHVELHTDTGRIADVMAALPLAIPLVLDHFAKPAVASLHDETVVAVRRRRGLVKGSNIHVKLSAPYRLNTPEQAKALSQLWLAELGPQSLLWGSDWPSTNHETLANYPELHDALGDWLADRGHLLAMVVTENPLRLYWS